MNQKAGAKGPLLAGLGWGFFSASLDPLMAGLTRSSYLLGRGRATPLVLEGGALLWHLPALILASLAVGVLFRRRGRDFGPGHVPLGAAIAIAALYSLTPVQHANGLMALFPLYCLIGLAAGYGAKKLLELLPGLSRGGAILLMVGGWALAVSGLNLCLALDYRLRADAHLSLALVAVIFIAMALVLAWIYRGFASGRPALPLTAAATAAAAGVAALFLLVEPNWTPAEPSGQASPDAPHLVLIVADSLRADVLSPERTPNLAGLMSTSAVFTRAQSAAPWTAPSVTGLFTGRRPGSLKRGAAYLVPAEVPVLAEELSHAGYSTECLSANVFTGTGSWLLRGFQERRFLDHVHKPGRFTLLPMTSAINFYGRSFLGLPLLPDRTGEITDMAIERLRAAGERPLFLFLHYMDPHHPYAPPPELSPQGYRGILKNPFTPHNPFHVAGDRRDPQIADLREGQIWLSREDRQFIADLYLGEVTWLDRRLGELFAEVEGGKAPGGRPVLLVFTSDHGEEFWEHGDFTHGQSLYQPELHVPLMFYGQGVRPGQWQGTVSLLQVAPTIRDLLGLAPDPEADGESLAGIIRGEEGSRDFDCHSSEMLYFGPRTSLLRGPNKVIHDLFHQSFSGYDLAADPGEKNPIDPASSPALSELKESLVSLEQADRERSYYPAGGREDLEMQGKLRAIGYIR